MIRLKEFLLDDNNRSKFLDRAFFDRKVDFLVIYDDEIFHVFDKEEVWDVFLKYLNVENNATNQKVVFKYKYLCMEIEMRTTDDGKYPTIFMPMNKRINFNLLVEKIKEKIENELKDCPQSMCKQIINTIKNKEVFFFEEKTLETIVQRIKDIEKNNIYGIFISITAKAQKDINKVSETLQKISDILKGKKINLGAGMKGNDHDKILLFVSYNKKEDKNEKED